MEFAAAGQRESWGFLRHWALEKPIPVTKVLVRELVFESWCSRAGDETRTRNLLFTRQLRYRLRHASDAGTAYPSVAIRRLRDRRRMPYRGQSRRPPRLHPRVRHRRVQDQVSQWA